MNRTVNKNLLILTGAALGAYAAHWLMLFSFNWDDAIERCCISVLPQISTALNYYSWLPLIGAVLGAVIMIIFLSILSKLKAFRKPRT